MQPHIHNISHTSVAFELLSHDALKQGAILQSVCSKLRPIKKQNAATLSGHFPNAADAILFPDIHSDAKRDHQRENLWYHVGQSGKRA